MSLTYFPKWAKNIVDEIYQRSAVDANAEYFQLQKELELNELERYESFVEEEYHNWLVQQHSTRRNNDERTGI